MLRKITFAVLAVMVLILAYAATKPDSFRVQRSIATNAPSEKVFALINDFHNWSAWSPWEKLDPAMKRTHSGAASGKGAVYAWEGNSDVGAGRMEIIKSSAPSKVLIKLDFTQPFEAHNTAEFTIDGKGGATQVTWAMYGPSPYLSKVMQVFVSMDDLIGKDFESGLANLKLVAEQ